MRQILIIHGGNSFSSYDEYRKNLESSNVDYERLLPKQKWKSWIAEQMPDTDVLLPTFPNSANAVYAEWAIYFEKISPYLGDDVQLVGHSMGAMFLAKYLSQHSLRKKVKKLILIAGPYNDGQTSDFTNFNLESAISLPHSADEIHLFQSKDDPLVPFSEFEKYQKDLPSATSHIFEHRGHFIEPDFPELLELLQQK